MRRSNTPQDRYILVFKYADTETAVIAEKLKNIRFEYSSTDLKNEPEIAVYPDGAAGHR